MGGAAHESHVLVHNARAVARQPPLDGQAALAQSTYELCHVAFAGTQLRGADATLCCVVAVATRGECADENGGVGMGQWADEGGVATLTLKSVDSDKKEETVKVSHQIENGKLIVGLKNVTTGDEGKITLVRRSE